MDYNLKIDIMKIIRLIIAGIFIVMGFLAFSQSPGNFNTLRVTTLNGNMKANGTSLVTADTVLLKADTVRADAELYVRDSTLLQIIQANSSGLEVVGNVNNRVTTATGGDSIQGEPNLTFDGTTLNINNSGGRFSIGSGNNKYTFEKSTNIGAEKIITIPSISINTDLMTINSGNIGVNRIPYSTGATQYTSSSNLTFNGSTLTLTGTQLTTVQSQISATTNQIRFGTTNTTTITSPAPSASRTYTIPDAGANTNFIMGAGENTIANSGSTVPLTITKSGSANGLVINQTGSGSGLVVTNSGGGVALQAENITVDGNTIGSSNTDGNIVIQPNGTGQVNIGSQGNRRVITFFGAASGTTQFLGVRNNSGVERIRFLYNNDSPRLIISDEAGTVNWEFIRSNGTFSVLNGNILIQTGTLGVTGTRVSQGFFTNITSTNAVVVDSDSTLKQNITPITNATEKLLAINPVEYTWKSDSLNKVHYGVIAQEINEVLPNIVISNGETLGVAYGEIIPYLIAAIKELEARVKQLEGN